MLADDRPLTPLTGVYFSSKTEIHPVDYTTAAAYLLPNSVKERIHAYRLFKKVDACTLYKDLMHIVLLFSKVQSREKVLKVRD